jgi:hypothetical protein
LDTLEKPIESLAFLEKYHKSALNVERLSKTVKNASYGIGALGGVCFAIAGFCVLSNVALQTIQASKANSHPKLQSSMLEEGIENQLFD